MEGLDEAIKKKIVAKLKESKRIQLVYENFIDKTVCPDFGDWVELNYDRITRDKPQIDADVILKNIMEKHDDTENI